MHDNKGITRRAFTQSALAAAALAAAKPALSAAPSGVKMYKNLGVGHLRVKADLQQAMKYAAQYGFGGINADLGGLAKMSEFERKDFASMLKAHGLQWGSSGLPVEFRKDEDTFKKGMADLEKNAAILQSAGVTRVDTWIMPSHAELTYRENFRQHRNRLREAARILKDHGLRFGLEFVGPQTLLVAERYPFIHTQKEMLQLCDAIGTDNMGLLYDSYHWHCSGGTVDETLSLTNDLIVEVHVNDAKQGVPRAELLDGQRELPCATGVIDMKGFLNALNKIGYDGPVTVEPFNQPLWDMNADDALKATIASLDKAFNLIEA